MVVDMPSACQMARLHWRVASWQDRSYVTFHHIHKDVSMGVICSHEVLSV